MDRPTKDKGRRMPNITTVVEGRRGCGFRKPGNLYLRSDDPGIECGGLPLPLETCPCCGHGIKYSRAPRWIDADSFLTGIDIHCRIETEEVHQFCPLTKLEYGRSLLIWIGQKYYPTYRHFTGEARSMGISRQITKIPRGFKIGETWVFLAHEKVFTRVDVDAKKQEWDPGIFRIFRPQRIEYVVKGDDTEEKLEALEERGVTLVRVERKEIIEMEM